AGRPASLRPMFPGYAFVRIVGDAWGPICNTFGVIRLLTGCGGGDARRPQQISDDFISSMRSCVLDDPDAALPVLDPGTLVRVTRGPLLSNVAAVRWSREDRLGLLFSLLGRQVEIEFSLADVELV